MDGFIVGPMPVRTFFDSQMIVLEERLQIPQASFADVPIGAGELAMYVPLRDCIQSQGLCRGINVTINAAQRDPISNLGPDLAGYSDKNFLSDTMCDFGRMEFFIEVKPEILDDPFLLSPIEDKNAFLEKSGKRPNHNRGQIISYAECQLSRQHRVFLFSLLICGQNARIMRWDRAGAIVTREFDYKEHPELLAEFFWRYSKMSEEERGFDVTVRRANNEERLLLKNAITKYDRQTKQKLTRPFPELASTLDAKFLTYCVTIPLEKGSAKYIIQKPFFPAMSLCGRATRGYIAYGKNEKRLVFLKDTWRTVHPNCQTEAEIYCELKPDVDNLPIILQSGDVLDSSGSVQMTITQEWIGEATGEDDWLQRVEPLRTHIHHRIIQEILFPMQSLQDATELALVFRDIISSIYQAYHGANRLHRDVSFGNVMIYDPNALKYIRNDTPDTEAVPLQIHGILNDWDHSRKFVKDALSTQIFRTGTWQFMSVTLLSDPLKPHEIHDDLESCYWVLVYIALHYFKHDRVGDRAINVGLLFNAYQKGNAGTGGLEVGGEHKANFLDQFRSYAVIFTCPGLENLVSNLGEYFLLHYNRSQKAYKKSATDSARAEFKVLHDRIRDDSSELDEIFEQAMQSSVSWADGGIVSDQFPAIGQTEYSDREQEISRTARSVSRSKIEPLPQLAIGSRVRRLTASISEHATRSALSLPEAGSSMRHSLVSIGSDYARSSQSASTSTERTAEFDEMSMPSQTSRNKRPRDAFDESETIDLRKPKKGRTTSDDIAPRPHPFDELLQSQGGRPAHPPVRVTYSKKYGKGKGKRYQTE